MGSRANVLVIGSYPMLLLANLVRNIASPVFQAPADAGDVEQPAQRRIGDEACAGQQRRTRRDRRHAGLLSRAATVSAMTRPAIIVSASRPSGSGTRKAKRLRISAQSKSGDVGAEPRPGRADGAVLADQHVGQHHIGGDDRGRVDQVEANCGPTAGSWHADIAGVRIWKTTATAMIGMVSAPARGNRRRE